MTKLFSFGDSWVAGHRGDFYHQFSELGVTPTHTEKDYGKYENYLKNNTSVPSLLCNHYNLINVNSASGGCGNYPQMDILLGFVLKNQISSKDIVMFGLSTFMRDRASSFKNYFDIVNRNGYADFLVDKDLYNENPTQVCINDYIIFLSTLDKLSKVYGFKLILFNLWTNTLGSDVSLLNLFKFKFVVGFDLTKNTWYDIIMDRYGESGWQYYDFKSIDKLPDNQKKLMAYDGHPSQLGYEKIANWIIDKKIIEKCLT